MEIRKANGEVILCTPQEYKILIGEDNNNLPTKTEQPQEVAKFGYKRKGCKNYTRKEEKFILDNFESKGVKYVARELKRAESGILAKYYKLIERAPKKRAYNMTTATHEKRSWVAKRAKYYMGLGKSSSEAFIQAYNDYREHSKGKQTILGVVHREQKTIYTLYKIDDTGAKFTIDTFTDLEECKKVKAEREIGDATIGERTIYFIEKKTREV